MRRYLNIDIETYSSVSLKDAGVYKYVDSDDFEVLLFGYSVDGGVVEVIDLKQGERIPANILEMLTDPSVEKRAFNDTFERVALSAYLGTHLSPEQWHCTMIKALYLGLPGSLAGVGEVLGFGEDKAKKSTGKSLINYFCVPCKPTKKNGKRTRNLPEHDPEAWKEFIEYNRQDVVAEMEIGRILDKFPLPDREWDIRYLDQRINDRGVLLEEALIDSAIAMAEDYTKNLLHEAKLITGLENPNSVAQLKNWIQDELGEPIPGLRKDVVGKLLAREDLPPAVRDVLEIRLKLGKSSIKKYQRMKLCRGADGRARGLLQFYGANRTGRWAGRLIQVQNLPQNKIPDLEVARNLRLDRDTNALDSRYGGLPNALSQLIRTAFIPAKGKKFLVADFSAIEARVLAWLAEEHWRLDVFNTHGKIYEASASQMFKVPVDSIKKGDPLRQKGKVAELALGYGGSVGALVSMKALEMGLTEEELPPLVEAWRQANPNIVKFWWAVDEAAKQAIMKKTTTKVGRITFIYKNQMLFIELPSGRRLAYVKPKIAEGPYGRDIITYEGMKENKWQRIDTYGPKLVENITQGVARDFLREAMINVDKVGGYDIVMHVHDEIIAEGNEKDLDRMVEAMCKAPEWGAGMPLKADGYTCDFYMKD